MWPSGAEMSLRVEDKLKTGDRGKALPVLKVPCSIEIPYTAIQNKNTVMSHKFLAFSPSDLSFSQIFPSDLCVRPSLSCYNSSVCFTFVLLFPIKAPPPFLKGHNGLMSSI